MSDLPLEGFQVADFSQGVAGPICAMLLGDLGATVIKVEPKRGDWIRSVGRKVEHGMSPTYLSLNRNKRGICVDMKEDRGIAALRKLAAGSDILVESFRPGVMDRFGLGFDTLKQDNPALVYASITGYGRQGPYVELPGADSVIQAMGGIMSINGQDGGDPLRFGMFMVDMITGMTAYQGVLGAMLGRMKNGTGRHLHTSLLDAILAFQAPPLTEYRLYGQMPERNGNVNSFVAPSGVFKTKDSFLMFTALEQHWPACCEALEITHLRDDPRFAVNAERLTHREELLAIVRERLATRTTTEWLEVLRKHDILCAPINDYATLVNDPQVAVNDLLRTMEHPTFGQIPFVANPVRFEGLDLTYTPPPALGEHTREVFQEQLGYPAADVEAMLTDDVIRQA